MLAVGLLGGSLSGCGGTPDAGPPPSPPTTAPTATPTPTAPVMPDAARANTKAGAVAFVRHYVDLLDHAIKTGDVFGVRSLTARSCGSCMRVIRQIDRIYRNGGHSDGGTWTVVNVQSAGHPARGSALVYAVIRFSPQTLYRTSSASPTHFPGGKQIFNFQLDYRGSWRLTDLTTAA
ncbi:MAG: DUF6318 family protein [Marmoricola sp.]